jgi:uncharacterized membrane-anchored protein YhcB (DUF1043 family)
MSNEDKERQRNKDAFLENWLKNKDKVMKTYNERNAKKRKDWIEAHDEKVKTYNEKNAEKVKAMKANYESIYDERATEAKAYNEKNREKISARRKKIRATPEGKAKVRAYLKKNRVKINAQKREYAKKRRSSGYFTTTIENKEWGEMKAKELMKIQFTEEE